MDYSEWTPIKNTIVRGIFAWWLPVCVSIMERYRSYSRFYYIDMNAADGNGSPTFFLDAVTRTPMPYSAMLIEVRKSIYAQLAARYSTWPTVQLYHGDHNVILPQACRAIIGKPYGLIYNDPCGIPSFDTLATVSRLSQIQHIDMLVNCTANAIKRKRGASKQDIYLVDGLERIQKKVWLVRDPEQKWQWTILLGTNWTDVKEWRAQKFYRIDTPRGQDILRRLNLTHKEQDDSNGQLRLPGL